MKKVFKSVMVLCVTATSLWATDDNKKLAPQEVLHQVTQMASELQNAWPDVQKAADYFQKNIEADPTIKLTLDVDTRFLPSSDFSDGLFYPSELLDDMKSVTQDETQLKASFLYYTGLPISTFAFDDLEQIKKCYHYISEKLQVIEQRKKGETDQHKALQTRVMELLPLLPKQLSLVSVLNLYARLEKLIGQSNSMEGLVSDFMWCGLANVTAQSLQRTLDLIMRRSAETSFKFLVLLESESKKLGFTGTNSVLETPYFGLRAEIK